MGLGGILGRGLKSIPWKMGVMSGFAHLWYSLFLLSFPPGKVERVCEARNRGVFDALVKSEPRFIRLRDEEGRTPRRQSSGAIARDNNGLLPIHLASIKGHVDVARALLQYWPDSRELLNCHGQNILHVAAKSRGHKMAAGAPLAYCRKAVNAKKKQASMQLEKVNIDSYKDRFNTLLFVSTLIATVTFAAGCTIPGGYNNIEPDQGIGGTATTGDHSHQSKEEMIST
ncbi:unnamed protein product [Camellia sinensis]